MLDARQQKAQELAERAQIVQRNGYWLVPSQSTNSRHKVVLGALPSCTCKDFELRDEDCKHILAVRLFIERQAKGEGTLVPSTEPAPKVKRPTYRQDWTNYNAATVNEKRHFQELLYDLCRDIPQPPPKGGSKGGRPAVSRSAAIFSACFKVYSTFSGRRFVTDLAEAYDKGFIDQLICYNSVFKCLESPEITPILHDLIHKSCLPLKEVEVDFAGDSTGFCTSRFIRWFDVKYGITRQEAEWVKVHMMVGVKTNIVTAVEILDKHAGDSPQLPNLVKTTAQTFKIREVSVDTAYNATENYHAVEGVGGTMFSPFKKCATGGIGGVFEKAFHYFCLHREEFLAHYHKRSNIESSNSMIKAKFGDAIRSKTDTAMKNEALCKILAHNICCVISAMYELGITPVFWRDEPDDNPDVLPFIRQPG
jgi:transposase